MSKKYTEEELTKALLSDVCYVTLRLLAEMYSKNSKDVINLLEELIPTEEKQKQLQDRAMFFAYQAHKQLDVAKKFYGSKGVDSLIKRGSQQFDKYSDLMNAVLDKHNTKH